MAFADPPPFAAFEHRDARDGFEVAYFRVAADAVLIEGQASAVEDGAPFAVSYAIELDRAWHTRRARVTSSSLKGASETVLETDGEGAWAVDGAPADELAGCLDVDLEASAVTNALPVRRLALAVGEHARAAAAYVRARDGRVERLEQRYERLADGPGGHERYAYEAPAFSFACELSYDAAGLVTMYPGIAVRTA